MDGSDLEWRRSNPAPKQNGEEDSNKTAMITETRGSMNSSDNNNNARGRWREAGRILGMVAARLTQEGTAMRKRCRLREGSESSSFFDVNELGGEKNDGLIR